jgi:hypothetical protein
MANEPKMFATVRGKPTPCAVSKLALEPDEAEKVRERELEEHERAEGIRKRDCRDAALERERKRDERKLKRRREEKSGRVR